MMTKLSRGARPRLCIEALEKKQMLAGDVLVSVVGGHLLIDGDADANQIVVSSGEDPGSFLVRGLDGTTVHMAGDDGAPSDQSSVEATGVRGNVRIAMGEGDDVVHLRDANFRRNVAVTTGPGADRVLVGLAAAVDATEEDTDGDESNAADVAVRGSLTIRTGADGDEVRVADAVVGRLLSVATGGGDDRVVLGAAPVVPATDDPAASGEGEAAAAETVEQETEEDGAADPQHLLRARAISVLLGEGEDAASLNDVGARRGVAVGGGEGPNRIGLHDVDAGWSLRVSGGRGEAGDNVVLEDVTARLAWVRTGAGDDHVRIADSAFAALGVSTGAGDDEVSVAGTKARWAAFLGGAGEDALNEADDNEFGRKFVRGFEIPAPPAGDGDGETDAGGETGTLARPTVRARLRRGR